VERADIIVDDLSIDPRKAEYLRASHGVDEADVFEVFRNVPAYFLFDARWGIYDMIGPNVAGRFLVVGIQRVENND
jgi:hypothetical protein